MIGCEFMSIIKFLENLRKDHSLSELGNQIDKIRRRHADTKSIGFKKSFFVILLGMIGIAFMTIIDMEIMRIQPEGYMKNLLTFGYYFSMLISLLIIYGLLELIKAIFAKK